MKKVSLTINSRGKAQKSIKCRGCKADLKIVKGYDDVPIILDNDLNIDNFDLYNDEDLKTLRGMDHISKCDELQDIIINAAN